MNSIDFQSFQTYTMQLFPRTDMSSAGMAQLWAEALQYADLDDAKAAVKAHRKESAYQSITIKQFGDDVRKIIGRRKAEERKAARDDTPVPEQYCGMFIECMKAPKFHPNWRGVQIPIMRSLKAHPSPEEVRAAAAVLIAKHQKTYGASDWEIIDDPDGRLYYQVAWAVFDDEREAEINEQALAQIREGRA